MKIGADSIMLLIYINSSLVNKIIPHKSYKLLKLNELIIQHTLHFTNFDSALKLRFQIKLY